MGYLHRFQRCMLPHTNSQSVPEVHTFSCPGSVLPVKALPFGLSTAPMEFVVVAKEVKVMALQRGIRIHQYLDDWLVRATYHHICLQHTQTLVALCRELGWLVNREKSELGLKQVFNFVGYQFDLKEGRKQATYKLELKAIFLALKEFQGLCLNNIVLVTTDNTTVVAYINKEGG